MIRKTLTFTLALAAVLGASAAVASAKTITASSGGVTAKLSYRVVSGGYADMRLRITKGGKLQYDAKVSSKYCAANSCDPIGRGTLRVADLYGDGGREVALTLFTGGADCCTIMQVFTHSAAISAYTLQAQHNFGDAGVTIRRVGSRLVLVSGDSAFYCRYSACYQSALPIEQFVFANGRFQRSWGPNALVRADAARWWRGYTHAHSAALRRSLLAAWTADEYNLNRASHAAKVLAVQVRSGRVTSGFVKGLKRLLHRLGYPEAVALTG